MIAACGQMEATTMDQAADVWEVVDRLAAQASEEKADLFVLPETTYPAYYLESAERYMQPDIERSANVLERFSRLAAKHALWLVAGFVEEDQDRIYNSVAVFDRAGTQVGIARKNFLWDCDHQWFTPGDTLSVFDWDFGNMGVLICADARVPEIPATLVNDGAQLIVEPTAWVNTSKIRRTYRNAQPEFMIRARAMEFGVPFVCCSKAGWEGKDLEYVGQSQIVSAEGKVLAQAPIGGEHVVVAELTPCDSHAAEIDNVLRQRLLSTEPPFRPDKPGAMCTVNLRKNADAIATQLEAAGARVARLGVADLNSYAPSRCRALDGAQVLIAQGRVLDDTFARTRAAENRVFVIMASEEAHLVLDPDGVISWRRVDWQDTLELDFGQADIKQFNPNTNLWSQRRVECYHLET